jgi:hypothetical protein|tara:strand:- start:6266 stop:6577 length:312 start_codon:yes stop_codon:yes gene_type:complete
MFFNPKHFIAVILAWCFTMGLTHEITLNALSETKYGNEIGHNGQDDAPESDMDDVGHDKIFEETGLWTEHFSSKTYFVLHFYQKRSKQLIGLSHPTPPPEFLV